MKSPYSSPMRTWLELLLDWIDRQKKAAQQRPMISTSRKIWLLPLPLCLATGMSSVFWNLGQVLHAPFLGGVTAVLGYILLLVATLGLVLFPIRHRPFLTMVEKLLSLPFLAATTIVAGWIWLVMMDQGGRESNLWDLCWWCGLISFVCASMAYL